MEFDSVVSQRRSVRSYQKRAVNWRWVIDAIDAARQTPLAGNNQTLRFLNVMNPDHITKLADFAQQPWITEVSHVVVICSDEAKLEKLYGERGRIYAHQQAGAAIQTFLLKIVDRGASACWVGAFDHAKVRDLLSIPANIQIAALIPVGHAKRAPLARHKRTLKHMMYWDKWDNEEMSSFFEDLPYHSEKN